MDHFFPYGPWPTDFAQWNHFLEALYKSSRETTTMDARIDQGRAGFLVITPAARWEIRPKVGEWIIISRTHPTMDKIVSGTVTRVSNDSFHIEWKTQWGQFGDFAAKVQPEDKRCPKGHFRVDMEIECISTGRVEQALHRLTEVRGMEDHNVTVLTPVQAMITLNCFMASHIKRINDAEAGRLLQKANFVPTEVRPNDKRGMKHGASDASGASDAHGASDAKLFSATHCASDAYPSQPFGASDANTQDAWVRPCRYVVPPSDSDFASASRRAGLNDVQQHAMTITDKHRLVLVRGPPGTGKTQVSSAVINAWARNVTDNDIVIAAGPSNTATDNLLDRSASLVDRRYHIGRLGEGKSVFDAIRVRYSLTAQAREIAGPDAKKTRTNQLARQLITDGQRPVIFATYMKSAELKDARPLFTLADEAGQATEPTTAVLLANAAEGGHIMIVGDEHQLGPTVRDRRAEWDGLSCPLLARLYREHKGLDHDIMLAIQYRMHPDIQIFPNTQYYDRALLRGLTKTPEAVASIPWPPMTRKVVRPGPEHTGGLVLEQDPLHRVLYVHCRGEETNTGVSPSNMMHVRAVEHLMDKVHHAYRTTPTVLVLTPYRGQHTLLTERLSRFGNSRPEVSTIDAAQGQEADLVIISLVRANATGSVGFTDDAKRLNVAITRAKAGVIIVGHLATTLAAGTSGIASLLHDLRKQGAIFEYARPGANHPLTLMTKDDFDKYDSEFPAETLEARNRRKRNAQDRTLPRDTREVERAPEDDTRHAVENTRWHPNPSPTPSPSRWQCLTSAPLSRRSSTTTTSHPTA